MAELRNLPNENCMTWGRAIGTRFFRGLSSFCGEWKCDVEGTYESCKHQEGDKLLETSCSSFSFLSCSLNFVQLSEIPQRRLDPPQSNCLNSILRRFESETRGAEKGELWPERNFSLARFENQFNSLLLFIVIVQLFLFPSTAAEIFRILARWWWEVQAPRNVKQKANGKRSAESWGNNRTLSYISHSTSRASPRALRASIAGFTIYVSYGTECHHFLFSSPCSIHRFVRFSQPGDSESNFTFWGQKEGN